MVEVEFSLSEPDSGEGDGKSSPRAGVVDGVSEMVRGSKRASRLGRGREAMLVDVLVERSVSFCWDSRLAGSRCARDLHASSACDSSSDSNSVNLRLSPGEEAEELRDTVD